MTQTLSPDTLTRLNVALSSWEQWMTPPQSEPRLVCQLGGHTNESFRVSDSKKDWVVRINSSKADAGINRHNELMALAAANSGGFAPGLAYHTADLLVVDYLSGGKPTLNDLPAIGSMFSRVHSLKVDAKPIDLQQHLENYYSEITPGRELSRYYLQFKKLQRPEMAAKVLCHQDLTLDNMIQDEMSSDLRRNDKNIYIIDWEYTHLSDPAYDLAVFSHCSNLNESQLSVLLKNYLKGYIKNDTKHNTSEEDNLRERVHYWEIYYALLEILWWHDRDSKPEMNTTKLEQLLDQV